MEDDSRNGSITIRASKWWLTLFAALMLAPWGLFLVLNPPDAVKRLARGVLPAKGGADDARWVASRKGPWGELRIVRIVTEPPEETLAGFLLYPRPSWFFKGYAPADLDRLALSAGLSPAQKAALQGGAAWSAAGCVVSPPDELVLSLSPGSRAALYNALSLFPENTFQNEPFRFRSDMAEEWFESSGVPEATLARVRRLAYVRGKTLLFSDPHLVLPALPSDLDRVRLLKALSRQSTLMVQLHVSPETDIASLVAYWGAREGRGKDIKPLLESAARVPGGVNLDIAHLLPRFARKRLYTYPQADGDSGEMVYDCHWNSMNFWNDPPDDRYSNNAFVIRTLESDYAPVLDAFRFGDVILFMKSDTQAIHSAVFIADDIVFTKNGPSQHSPWILMQMQTLTAHYETNADLTIRGYRKKPAP